MQKKFFIKTFGCQMNKYDSDMIAQILKENGGTAVIDPEEADILLVNTCSVRGHAEQRAVGFIATLKKWRSRKDRLLGVIGCMAKRLGDEIATKFSHVDLILGPDSYQKINDYLTIIIERKTKIIDTDLTGTTYCGIRRASQKISDFVAIMRGCNNFCSYCIVPFVRGQARSRPVEEIIAEIETLITSGVKDITLLGQNVNEYWYNGIDFPLLLKQVAENTNLFRLRFLTSHPKDLNDQIIEVVATHKNICEWFHLPLQSGANRILTLMNRHYTKEDYIDLIDRIRKRIPEATITTDVMVGFPSETEVEFSETLSVMKAIEFDDAYMYRYSARAGTAAAKYESLSEEIIKDRLRRLIELQNKIIIKKTEKMINKKFEVLLEARTKNNATRGKTRGNKDVVVEKELPLGEVREVIIKGLKGRTPIGEIV